MENNREHYEALMKLNYPFKPEQLDRLIEIASANRNEEINRYWQRAAYFVLFVGALFVGYYSLCSKSCTTGGFYSSYSFCILRPMISLVGVSASYIWFLANRGSKYWQKNWEAHLDYLLAIRDGVSIYKIVLNPNMKSHKAHSVSQLNAVLSIIITIAWAIIFANEAFFSFLELKNGLCNQETMFVNDLLLFQIILLAVVVLAGIITVSLLKTSCKSQLDKSKGFKHINEIHEQV